jgi:hypothetical protein
MNGRRDFGIAMAEYSDGRKYVRESNSNVKLYMAGLVCIRGIRHDFRISCSWLGDGGIGAGDWPGELEIGMEIPKLILEFALALTVSRLAERMILTCAKSFWNRVVLWGWAVIAR